MRPVLALLQTMVGEIPPLLPLAPGSPNAVSVARGAASVVQEELPLATRWLTGTLFGVNNPLLANRVISEVTVAASESAVATQSSIRFGSLVMTGLRALFTFGSFQFLIATQLRYISPEELAAENGQTPSPDPEHVSLPGMSTEDMIEPIDRSGAISENEEFLPLSLPHENAPYAVFVPGEEGQEIMRYS